MMEQEDTSDLNKWKEQSKKKLKTRRKWVHNELSAPPTNDAIVKTQTEFIILLVLLQTSILMYFDDSPALVCRLQSHKACDVMCSCIIFVYLHMKYLWFIKTRINSISMNKWVFFLNFFKVWKLIRWEISNMYETVTKDVVQQFLWYFCHSLQSFFRINNKMN